MINIELLKISLMERKGEIKNDGSKTDYMVKSTASLKFNEYVEKTFPNTSDEDKDRILQEASEIMYNDLLSKSNDLLYDSVGIWITIDEKILENAISLAVLSGIKEHGEEGIVPIYEFIKMTIPENGQS